MLKKETNKNKNKKECSTAYAGGKPLVNSYYYHI